MTKPRPFPPAALYRPCDPGKFSFESTAELSDLTLIFGQQRAAHAIAFGIGMASQGYNLFVMGPAGSGKHEFVRRYIADRAELPKPGDWVYVHNFDNPYKPVAMALPAGQGAALRDDMVQLVEELRTAIPAVFEGDEYRSRAGQIQAEYSERHERAFSELSEEAAKQQIALLRTPAGFTFAPLKDDEVINADDYAKLPQEQRDGIEKAIRQFQAKLENIIHQGMRWRKEQREKVKQLNREMTLFAVGHHVAELKERYHELPHVIGYLEAVHKDVLDNAEDFLRGRDAQAGASSDAPGGGAPSFRRYEINVLVDHGGRNGLPVVVEDHPTYQNLIGRVDHIAQFGTLVTDFGLIKPGALHRANGGYLLLDAYKLLTQPHAWEGLKRALSARQIRIESLGEIYSLVSTVSLAPEPIPLDVKVVLFGDRMIYYLLHAYDPEFPELFKVMADFEDRFERTAENDQMFAKLVATMGRQKGLLPFDRGAVARMIEHSARLSGEADRLSANLQSVADLLCEADYWARAAKRSLAGVEDVERAIQAQRERADRMRERVHEAILRGLVLIDTAGARVGQVNGLSVMQLGGYAFAAPTRITATTRLGEGQVIDVQREVQLGGAIHSKGVMILSAFLATRYSTNRPHSLSASLVFEQTYGVVDGDSASLAELCALLSSLADLPIRQSLAVTGSVNQVGEVQAIGGVNEKIEGFFDICKARALNGEQGVLVPQANAGDLMLRADVLAAAAAGQFHVYPVRSVDEAIELLLDMPAGVQDAVGGFPPDSVNGRVSRRLQELSMRRERFSTGRRTPRAGKERKPS